VEKVWKQCGKSVEIKIASQEAGADNIVVHPRSALQLCRKRRQAAAMARPLKEVLHEFLANVGTSMSLWLVRNVLYSEAFDSTEIHRDHALLREWALAHGLFSPPRGTESGTSKSTLQGAVRLGHVSQLYTCPALQSLVACARTSRVRLQCLSLCLSLTAFCLAVPESPSHTPRWSEEADGPTGRTEDEARAAPAPGF
jgi:hypothetical protein